MIKICGLTKSFDQNILYKDFNLTIESGEFVVLSGPSGCGKTTLLNMVGSIEKIDSGSIFVDGIDVCDKKNQLKYLSTKVGFLFQNFALIEDKSVKYNLNIVKKNNRSNIAIDDALSVVGLKDKISNMVYTLSGGEQQRIALARLMIKKCDIILADEPTGSLDNNNAKKVIDILETMNRMGNTIIIASHADYLKKDSYRVIEL